MSPRPHLTFTRPLARALVLWLIALVLPLQGTAAGVFAALGPAHLHASPQKRAADTLVLEDVRRWKPAAASQAHAPGWLGHVHTGAAPQRHHHGADDGSVVRTGSDAVDDDAAAGVTAVPVLALIPAGPAWLLRHAPVAAQARAQWRPRTGFTRQPERPPKFG